MALGDSSRRRLLGAALGFGALSAASCSGVAPKDETVRSRIGGRRHRHSDRIPDVALVDHTGRRLSSRQDVIADRAVLLNFFYCECQGSCPGTVDVMFRLRKELSSRLPNLVLLSITLAPETDTVDALAAYARDLAVREQPDLAPWHFVTGKPADLEALRIGFGLRDPDPVVDADRTNHAALLSYGNDALDRWGAMPAGVVYPQLRRGILRMIAPGVSV